MKKNKNNETTDQSVLKNSAGTVLKTGPLTEEDLIIHNSATNYMDLTSFDQTEYDNVVYSNVFTGNDGKIVIQYWFFYLNPPGGHEGGQFNYFVIVFQLWQQTPATLGADS